MALKKGIVTLALSAGLWGCISAWVFAPDWLPWIERLWWMAGSPGWLGRVVLLFTGLAMLVALLMRVAARRPDSV